MRRGAQSEGIRLARYTLRNHLPSFLFEIWSFSREARYTVTRITLFQFADTTSMSVPQFKDFPGARESASSPALTKINVPTAFAPRTHALYHFPPPRVNRRAPPKLGCSRGDYDTNSRLTAQSVSASCLSRKVETFALIGFGMP